MPWPNIVLSSRQTVATFGRSSIGLRGAKRTGRVATGSPQTVRTGVAKPSRSIAVTRSECGSSSVGYDECGSTVISLPSRAATENSGPMLPVSCSVSTKCGREPFNATDRP